MECVKLRSRFSEYIDGFLDVRTNNLVEEHIAACKKCRQELEKLQLLVQKLGDMEQIKAPDDFLEKFNARIAKRSTLRTLITKPFMPFGIKIPYPFATATAMAILLFLIIHTPEMKNEMPGIQQNKNHARVKTTDADDMFEFSRKDYDSAPLTVTETKRITEQVEKEPMPSTEQVISNSKITSITQKKSAPQRSDKKAYLQKPATAKAISEFSKRKAIMQVELALVLKSENSIFYDTLHHDRNKKPITTIGKGMTYELRSSDVNRAAHTIKKDSFGGYQHAKYPAKKTLKAKEKISDPEKLSPEDKLTSVEELINDLNGTIISTGYYRDTGQPEFLLIEIPAKQYLSFCKRLPQFGTLKPSTPPIEAKNIERIRIHIHFIHP